MAITGVNNYNGYTNYDTSTTNKRTEEKEDALRSVPINQLFGLSRTSLSLVVGQSKKLTVSNAKNVKWRSSDRTVASVSKNGVVKAKKAETATITAKTSGKNLRSRDECQTCDQKRTEIYRAV